MRLGACSAPSTGPTIPGSRVACTSLPPLLSRHLFLLSQIPRNKVDVPSYALVLLQVSPGAQFCLLCWHYRKPYVHGLPCPVLLRFGIMVREPYLGMGGRTQPHNRGCLLPGCFALHGTRLDVIVCFEQYTAVSHHLPYYTNALLSYRRSLRACLVSASMWAPPKDTRQAR
jgi:hypothetical protein